MSFKFDLVLRGGTVVDGSGGAPFIADVAIRGDLIVAVGTVTGAGAREIDAAGLLVTPGFVDVHTHYDGQATWSERITPSSDHGVTTVVLGNCGVGFAPCRAEDRERLVELMEGVEDIPEVVMAKGLRWNWQSFPEYLDVLEQTPHDIDVGAYLPHSPLRVYAMGERGINREAATSDDIATMKRLAREAIDAGALGFSTSRVLFHRTAKGELIPSYDADWGELRAICEAMGEAGAGVFQIARDRRGDLREEMRILEDLARGMQRPIMLSATQLRENPDEWRGVLQLIEDANARGDVKLLGQVFPRPVGMIVGHTTSNNPFRLCPSFATLADLPLDEKVAELRKPEVRARLVSEKPDMLDNPLFALSRQFDRIFLLTDPPNYEPSPEDSVAALAAKQDKLPEEVAYDLLLEDNGHALLYIAIANYAYGNLDFLETVLPNRDTVIGLGDGGAHYGMICDASYTTFALTHWARDREGKKFSIAEVVNMLARRTAHAVGLDDRGVVAPGYKADVNVIDFDKLQLHAPVVVRDLPGDGQRFHQRADGYVATIVSGQVIAENGQPNSARPGRLVRGPQTAAMGVPITEDIAALASANSAGKSA